MSEFDNKIVLITGAASGIGKALVTRMIERGAQVLALDESAEKLALLQQEMIHTVMLETHCVDIKHTEQIENVLDIIIENYDHVDHFVNVAGILETDYLVDTSDEQWERVFAVNTFGAFKMARCISRLMIDRKQGNMVFVSSNASSTPRIKMGAYAASKAATTQMARCLGLELARFGIRVNVVSPGSTDTPMQHSFWQNAHDATAVIQGDNRAFRTGIPLGRIASPDDVADAITFLLSEQAKHITLHDMRVDGGATFDMR
ncbi:2,3-dihydro-2,3-dihydroxybenzoate dehydrogenase [Cernens ardua]|uniref:2,3-dihydro-2,3-dihydroxybenzoate dehydrogenase n=1 Tax=Cernens ardua TaxID=3402176 RepID=UPI003F9CB764